MLTLTAFFKRLEAPLKNTRWSWGAVRYDGAIFLRVWQDEVEKHQGLRCIQITYEKKFTNEHSSAGYPERLEHVKLIQEGSPCYLVMCEAQDVHQIPRKTKSLNQEHVFKSGKLIEVDGDWWLEIGERISVNAV
jgi:hypothetical protein